MVNKASASENVVDMTGNDFLDTLIIGDRWNDDHAVTFYFDDGSQPEDVWLDAAKDALRNVFSTYETYIDVQFQEVASAADANFVLRMDSLDEIAATARFGHPDESDDQALGQFPFDWSRWTPWHLQVGGYAYETAMHEVGHGLGLGHPHDTGGLNGQTFPGVENSGDHGDDGQNNAIYTVMSYLDHSQFWAPMPATSDLGWGYIASPMGLDIAALQHIYGANPTTAAGNDTYTLPTVNGDGTYWRAIWDTGGTDMIRHTGSAPATIDLRAAPLTGPDAGGYLSRVDGIAGGFTIANGVTVEYASGGSGDDTIIGNGAANELAGNGGDDAISGNGGADLMDGGSGNDTLNGGTGNDTMIGGAGDDKFIVDAAGDELHEGAGGGIDTVVTTVTRTLGANFENLQLAQSNTPGIDGYGNALANQIIGNADGNVLEGKAGDDFLNGGAGNDDLDGGTGMDTLLGGTGNDLL
ncbi:MAG: M10 family metallopeptidase, partial [Alphaproteobacteria bacterium]